MTKRFTEREAQARLHRLPRLRLDGERRDQILQRTIAAANSGPSVRSGMSQRRPLQRRRWGTVAAAAAAVMVVGGAAAVYTHGKVGAAQTHHRGQSTTVPAAARSNQWMTTLQKRDLVAQAVANLFNGEPPRPPQSQGPPLKPGNVPITSMSASQDASGQRVYHVKMKGTFTNNHQQATYLSFMITADGSKVWNIRATTSPSQTQWTVTNSLHPQIRQFVYAGENKDWTGVYRQGSAQIWWKDSASQQTQLGSSHTSTGMVWYTGSGPVPNVSAYTVTGDQASGGQGRDRGQLSILGPKPQFSLPGLDMQSASGHIHISITANGHKMTFLLRDVAQHGATASPMMQVVRIQPQAGGVLIHVQGQAQPVEVAIDAKKTQGATGSSEPQASFIIRDARPVTASVTNFSKFNQTGNQFIRSISVTPQGSNLLVQLKLNQAVNTLNAGRAGSDIGVALQNQPSGLQQIITRPQSSGKLPRWFVTDMVFAGLYEGTPMRPVTYRQMLPHKSTGKYLLAAPADAKANPNESVTYTTYFGAIPWYGTLKDLVTGGSSMSSQLRTGYVEEVRNGKTAAVKATLFYMGNAWGFGFAKDQVIVYSQHGGIDTYTVYPVPDLSIGP